MEAIDNELERYFNFLLSMLDLQRFSRKITFKKLLVKLFETQYQSNIPNDINRVHDAIRFRDIMYDGPHITQPVSVLEVMISLAIRCEDIMQDESFGNRTPQWFWLMLNNIGLSGMYDAVYDEEYVEDVLHTFLTHQYEPTGKGSLFVDLNTTDDFRYLELWSQMCRYLNTL